MKCFLQYDGTYEPHRSIGEAMEAYLETARELDAYGQSCEASIHVAKTEETICEYPDFLLSLTPRGNVKCERT